MSLVVSVMLVRLRNRIMWNVWEKGAVGNPGRYLGTITGIDELSAMRQARLVFGCECYVVWIEE